MDTWCRIYAGFERFVSWLRGGTDFARAVSGLALPPVHAGGADSLHEVFEPLELLMEPRAEHGSEGSSGAAALDGKGAPPVPRAARFVACRAHSAGPPGPSPGGGRSGESQRAECGDEVIAGGKQQLAGGPVNVVVHMVVHAWSHCRSRQFRPREGLSAMSMLPEDGLSNPFSLPVTEKIRKIDQGAGGVPDLMKDSR